MTKCYDKITDDLLKSSTHGNVVSVKIKGEEKPILTVVEKANANRIVILKAISLYGVPLEEHIYHIEDIEYVRVHEAKYDDPVYLRIRELKNNIDEIRKRLRW